MMQTKEVTKLLGIPRERIKYFKRQCVFTPERPSTDNKNMEYTERDFTILKKLVVLTKSGLTCGDIKKVQDGEWTLQQAIVERRHLIDEEMKRMRGSLLLSDELLGNNVQYDLMPTDHYWDEIQQKEREGEVFMDVDDTYPVSLVRTVNCPYCGAEQEMDLEDYLFDQTSNESRFEDDMGPDVVYSFDSEDNCECVKCGKAFRVEGWIREYPVGACDSEDINVHHAEV